MTTILIVEDETSLAELEKAYLEMEHFDVTMIHRGDEAANWLQSNSVDLILLDLMLPGTDGLTIAREVQQTSQTPIIMTTAKVEEGDRLMGLEVGADDYLCKPFSLREMVARVKAVLRRTQADTAIAVSGVKVSEETHEASFENQRIELTAVETRLFATMQARPGQIFSRDQLIDRIYDDQRIVSDRTIDSHIKKLRKKLNELDPSHDYVRSVYGAGYRFEIKPA